MNENQMALNEDLERLDQEVGDLVRASRAAVSAFEKLADASKESAVLRNDALLVMTTALKELSYKLKLFERVPR